MLSFADVLRALEHHVLEQVGEARATHLLVPASHVVPHVHAHHRRGVVLGEDHAEPVGKRVHLVADRGLTGERTDREETAQDAPPHHRPPAGSSPWFKHHGGSCPFIRAARNRLSSDLASLAFRLKYANGNRARPPVAIARTGAITGNAIVPADIQMTASSAAITTPPNPSRSRAMSLRYAFSRSSSVVSATPAASSSPSQVWIAPHAGQRRSGFARRLWTPCHQYRVPHSRRRGERR